jgi:ATP-dependent helicase HrpA
MLVDQFPLRRKLANLKQHLRDKKPCERNQSELEQRIQQSLLLVEQRQSAIPTIEYPPLPISDKRELIAKTISENQLVVIAGETGSGKTTQLPKICLELGRGVKGLIGHTQPRRLAARTVAERIADELKTPLGDSVGYQVRFTDHTSPTTHIKLMTDGILLAEIQRDKWLNRYDTLIIDEAHERSLNIDFLLGYLKQLLPRRPDLKVIITSATIDVEGFAKHFADAPIIEVSGRTYPVDVWYRPLKDLSEDGELAVGVEAAINQLSGHEGDVLVFLSGEGEIREVARYLRKADLAHCEVLPLYARLSRTEQNKVFNVNKRRGRRIVLATNVAETSLTVPGIRYVIDPGYARISRYSYRTKVQRLPIEPVSQASANQRKGRCGRVADGICIRLYSEQDFLSRPEFTDPEIKRTNLASVILQMLTMRIGDVNAFPFVDPPDYKMINDGFKLLEELGAIGEKRQLSSIGKQLSRFVIEPRLSRMLLAANELGCLRELLIIVSALSIQDPRERPGEKQQASDEKHRRFWDEKSDFVGFVNLWNYYEEKRQELSQNQLRKLCQREFLSFMRMKEWRDIHRQLLLVSKELGFKENHQPASYETVHRAVLSGMLSHIAMLDEERQYLGARNRKLRIFPGSSIFKKTPKWLVAAEITETTQLYGRCCAAIQPEWVLGINDALFKRHHSEPHWQQRTGRVMAYEKLSLYGLVVRDRKPVHYGPIDPVLAREIFIRGALVEGRYKTRADFFKHNHQLVSDIEKMEEKARRRNILVNEQQLYDFYHERLPTEITTARHFEKWLKDSEKATPKLLFINREDLMQQGASDVEQAQFPNQLSCGDLSFSLSYRFEPGHKADGVTVIVPVGLLNRIPEYRFEWLVPGMLRDKCIALIKTLPKQLRKQLVPVPDYADKFLAAVEADNEPLLEVMSLVLKKITGINIPIDQFKPEQLDNFYRINYRIVDDKGSTLGESRHLDTIRQQFKGQVAASLQQKTEQRFHKGNIQQWDFGELPETFQFKQAGVAVTAYPALVDHKGSVSIELKDFPEEAEQLSRQGLIRLYRLQLPQQIKYMRKELLQGNAYNLQMVSISQQREQWLDDLIQAVFFQVFVEGRPLPRQQQDFDQCLQLEKSQLLPRATEAEALLLDIAKAYSAVRKQLKKSNQLAWVAAVADVNEQLFLLFKPGFIAETPWQWLEQYPRYLQAIERRLEKLQDQYQRDRQISVTLKSLAEPLLAEWKNNTCASEDLLQYRWLLEEFRVSLFAQQLGTRQPVSEKRLRTLWQMVKKASTKSNA